jgi:hypothetical protein
VLPKQYVNGGFINISANTVNGNSILTSISSTVGIANGQYVSGNNIPNGTRVANISGTNIYLTQPTTGNANGYIMTYLDILSGYIDEYVPNIVTFSSVSNITKADQFFIANNKTLLTTNYYSPKTEDLVYFMGENTERDVFGLPSEFIRIETEGRKEKFVFNVNKYISYTDNVYAYNVSSELNNLITENDEQVIATLYTKIE